jgi:uncharacterized protein (DUF2141 family)
MKFARIACCAAIVTLLILSCAKQSTPSGGPKDTIPPVLVGSIPAEKQKLFKSKKLELEFSELIILNNPKDQIIITPSIGKAYKITAKKKTAFIELDKSLSDSTTYNISFRDAIQDITEKNPARNLHLAFSTGSYLDSLSISGSVQELLTSKIIKDITVALYQNDTFNIFKHKPSYITKANDQGAFKIENLKPGKYWIYGYDDKNRNLIVDSKSESYGFIIEPITLVSNAEKILIPIQHLDARELKLTSARPYGNYFNLKASKYIKNFDITSDTLKLFSSFGDDAANIKIYNSFNTNFDSLKMNLTISDTLGNKLDTIVYVKFPNKKADKEKFSHTIDENTIEANKGISSIKLHFNKPIQTTNLDSAYIELDSLNHVQITKENMLWNSHFDQLEIKTTVDKNIFATENKKQPKKNLILSKGTFISVENDSSQKIIETPKILKEQDTALLLVKVKSGSKTFIVQLLDKTYKVIKSAKNTPDVRFENIQPGGYLIRLITDKNGNGELDLGNFSIKQEPEPIHFYKTEKGDIILNLKANWEVGPLLITD